MKLDDDALDRLLSSARQADLPDRARLEHIRSQLLPGPAGSAPQPSSGLKLTAKWLTAKTLIGVAVISLGGLGYWQLERASQPTETPTAAQSNAASRTEPARAQSPSAEVAPRATPTAPAEAVELAVPSKDGAPALDSAPNLGKRTARSRPRPRAAAAPHPPMAESQHASTLKEEAALLRSATLAVRAGDAPQAQRLLDRFERVYPKSQLKSEHDRIRRSLLEVAQPGN